MIIAISPVNSSYWIYNCSNLTRGHHFVGSPEALRRLVYTVCRVAQGFLHPSSSIL